MVYPSVEEAKAAYDKHNKREIVMDNRVLFVNFPRYGPKQGKIIYQMNIISIVSVCWFKLLKAFVLSKAPIKLFQTMFQFSDALLNSHLKQCQVAIVHRPCDICNHYNNVHWVFSFNR